MKLIMAVSADGFVARGPDDSMSWAGPLDKQLFRLMTMTGSKMLAAGGRTYDLMPHLGGGRQLVRLRKQGFHVHGLPRMSLMDVDVTEQDPKAVVSREKCNCMTLVDFAREYPDGWLIGGQTVALVALKLRLVHEMLLFVQNDVWLHSGMKCELRSYAEHQARLVLDGRTTVGDYRPNGGSVTVEHWRGC